MKKNILLILLVLAVFLVACSGKTGQDQDLEEKDYLKKYYGIEYEDLDPRFIGVDEFTQIDNKRKEGVVVIADPDSQACKALLPKLFTIAEDKKIDKLSLVKLEELDDEETDKLYERLEQEMVPITIIYKDGKRSEYIGDFDIVELTRMFSDFKRED